MPYPVDLGVRVVKKRRVEGKTVNEIHIELDVSESYVKRAIKRWDEQELLQAVGNGGTLHCDRRFDAATTAELKALVKHDDSLTLADYAVGLALSTHKFFSPNDVRRALAEMKYSRKTRTKHNNQADIAEQITFQQRMNNLYYFDQFMFADEASFDRKAGLESCAPQILRDTCRNVEDLLVL